MARGLLTMVCCCIALGAWVPAASAMPSLADPPPGANDFSCHPSAAHPHPVVMVHGLSATMGENWSYLSPLLKQRGYCLFALTYGIDPRLPGPYVGGTIPIEDSAPELAAFVDRVLAATGATKVDLLGHSEGTYMPQYYLKFLGGAAKVDRYVAMTPLYGGTQLAGTDQISAIGAPLGISPVVIAGVAALCGSCPEFVHDSDMQKRLVAGGAAVPGITYTTIPTRYDELVIPYTSGLLPPPATNHVLQDVCPADTSEHVAEAFDPVVAQIVFNALDPAHVHAVACDGTLPPPPAGSPAAASGCGPRAGSPHAYVIRRTLRASRRGLRIRGRAFAYCDATAGPAPRPLSRVRLALARVQRGRCAFLTPRSRFSRLRSCRRPTGLRVRGTAAWTFSTRVKLRPGRYRIYVYATDASGGREAQPARPNARARVR